MTALLPAIVVSGANLEAAAARIRTRSRPPLEVSRLAADIVDDTRQRGDAALLEYERRFGGTGLSGRSLRVSEAEIAEGARRAGPEVVKALRFSLRKVRRVQGALIPRAAAGTVKVGGFEISMKWAPVPSVGCYVPGGRASYPSSVIMTAGLAKLAGVERVVLATPPGKDGRIDPALLAAAKLVGVDEVYRMGGAQAIAALAYGTESVRRVSKIVGPGGRYASEAKAQVSREVAIDFYAGPTELIVFAGRGCEPEVVAWELVGQAEHGEDTLCGLVTCSRSLAAKVRSELARIVPTVARREYVEQALRKGFAAVCTNEPAACEFIDALAPEHLEILSEGAERIGARIHGAGIKLLGTCSPCAASDYVAGSDHVIPTMGLASARGTLSVLDFLKLEWSVMGSRRGLRDALSPLRTLASAEGLPNHYLSASTRFGEVVT